MNKIITFGILVFTGVFVNSQQVVINEKLLSQITVNHGVRLASEQAFLDSYEKLKKLYDEINNKTAQVIAIQEYIYQQLKNVNSALTQSKKLIYLYQYLGKIVNNSHKMLDLSAQHPEYAVLVSKYYVEIGKQTMKLQQEVTQDILNENKDFLMDASDREMLIEKAFTRVRNINGNILYIILRLENAKKIPYLFQVPILRNYLNIDKAIVGDIITKYKYLFN
jgi:Fe-S cluster biosynthesis and repair protein YggX